MYNTIQCPIRDLFYFFRERTIDEKYVNFNIVLHM